MTLDEIERRRERVANAEDKVAKAKKALHDAQADYAEQEAQKKGIIYNTTPVMVTKNMGLRDQKMKGPFMVAGFIEWWFGKPCYEIVKIKKDGSASKQSAGLDFVSLDQIEVAE